MLGDDGDHNTGGLLATAMRMLNAIPAVCAAPPGLLTPFDLPLVTGRNLCPPRHELSRTGSTLPAESPIVTGGGPRDRRRLCPGPGRVRRRRRDHGPHRGPARGGGGRHAALGRRALVFPADVSDLSVLDGLVAATVARLRPARHRGEQRRRLDAAAVPRHFGAGRSNGAFHFNVTTAFALTKAATPHLLDGGHGAVVNISSAMGRLRDRGFVAYGTAKAALAHMTRLARRRPRAACARERDRRGLGRDVGAGDRSHERRVAYGDGGEDSAAIASANPTTSRSPRCTSRRTRRASSPAKSFEVDGGIEAPNLDMHIPDL